MVIQAYARVVKLYTKTFVIPNLFCECFCYLMKSVCKGGISLRLFKIKITP